MADMNDKLAELAVSLFDLAVDCFAEGESNPIVVFIDKSGRRHMVDVKDAEGNVSPQLVESARKVISEGIGADAQRYALAYDGYLTTDGERLDAVFIETGERGQAEALLYAQRYRVEKRSGLVERVGKPKLLQAAVQLLR